MCVSDWLPNAGHCPPFSPATQRQYAHVCHKHVHRTCATGPCVAAPPLPNDETDGGLFVATMVLVMWMAVIIEVELNVKIRLKLQCAHNQNSALLLSLPNSQFFHVSPKYWPQQFAAFQIRIRPRYRGRCHHCRHRCRCRCMPRPRERRQWRQ